MAYSLKIIIVFIFILFSFRILGKRLVSQLTNYDLANIFVLSAIAAGPLITSDFALALTGMGVFMGLHLLLKVLGMNQKMREYILGKSKMLIEKGKISEKNLKSAKLTLSELVDELKELGYTNVADVEFAILENTGKITAVPKKDSKSAKDKKLCALRNAEETSQREP